MSMGWLVRGGGVDIEVKEEVKEAEEKGSELMLDRIAEEILFCSEILKKISKI